MRCIPLTVRRLRGHALATLLATGALLLRAPEAGAADPFEIQVYDADAAKPGRVGLELHLNTVVSGRREAAPPELPPHRQSHFTAETSIGITDWWEAGLYVQTALLEDGSFVYAGNKLRTKFILPARAGSPFGWAVNLEVGRLPARFDSARWGGEIRPIATWSSRGGSLYASVNPILDFSFTGPAREQAPAFEPAATICYVRDGLSVGFEYYASLGPVGSWLPAAEQEHYLFEVLNVLRWKHLEVNAGIGQGLGEGSNRFVVKTILGFR